MQRFFCTICGRVKRVQHLPHGVDIFQTKLSLRTGECRKHNEPIGAATPRPVYVKHRVSAEKAKTKSKRGG